jgi:hypothetical protein
VLRGYNQTAFFLSTDFDIIEVLTVSGGARHYKYDEFEHGSVLQATSRCSTSPTARARTAASASTSTRRKRLEGRASLPTSCPIAHPLPRPGVPSRRLRRTSSDAATCSSRRWRLSPRHHEHRQGLPVRQARRLPVGQSTGTGSAKASSSAPRQIKRLGLPDGLKSPFSLSLFDPTHLGNDFRHQWPDLPGEGHRLQRVARLFEGFTIQGSSAWNSSEQTDAPCLPAITSPLPTRRTDPAVACINQSNGAQCASMCGVLRHARARRSGFNVRARRAGPAGQLQRALLGRATIGSYSSDGELPDSNDRRGSPPTTTLLRYRRATPMTWESWRRTTGRRTSPRRTGEQLGCG